MRAWLHDLYWSKHTRYKYNGNFLLTENKHSKCFTVRQSKRLKFTLKMRQNTFGGRVPPVPARGSLSALPDPLATIRDLLLGEKGRKGERVERERKGREWREKRGMGEERERREEKGSGGEERKGEVWWVEGKGGIALSEQGRQLFKAGTGCPWILEPPIWKSIPCTVKCALRVLWLCDYWQRKSRLALATENPRPFQA